MTQFLSYLKLSKLALQGNVCFMPCAYAVCTEGIQVSLCRRILGRSLRSENLAGKNVDLQIFALSTFRWLCLPTKI